MASQIVGSLNVVFLSCFGTACQQQNKCGTLLNEIQSVTGAKMKSQFHEAIAYKFRISPMSQRKTTNTNINPSFDQRVTK